MDPLGPELMAADLGAGPALVYRALRIPEEAVEALAATLRSSGHQAALES